MNNTAQLTKAMNSIAKKSDQEFDHVEFNTQQSLIRHISYTLFIDGIKIYGTEYECHIEESFKHGPMNHELGELIEQEFEGAFDVDNFIVRRYNVNKKWSEVYQ